jgi:hypothetical protein
MRWRKIGSIVNLYDCPMTQSAKRRAHSEKLSKLLISTLCSMRYAILLAPKDQIFDVE